MIVVHKRAKETIKQMAYRRLVLPFKNKSRADQEYCKYYYNNQEFIEIMKISKRTAQRWRTNGYVGYFTLARRIYYDLADIQILFEENYKCKK